MNAMRFHAASGQWYYWDGERKRRVYLGADRMAAEAEYNRLAHPGEPAPRSVVTVAELLRQFNDYQIKADGKQHSSAKSAIHFTTELFGNLPANEFRLKCLRVVRDAIIAAPPYERAKANPKVKRVIPLKVGRVQYSRCSVNRMVSWLVAAYRWAAMEDLVPSECWSNLLVLPRLRAGRGGREPERITPVESWVVDATLPYCGSVLRDMIEIQRRAGMRPGELCELRWCDISKEPGQKIAVPNTRDKVGAIVSDGVTVWVAVPRKHKTAHKGKVRLILLGPACQTILQRYANKKPDDWLFVPRENSLYQFKPKSCRAKFSANRYGMAVRYAVVRANKARVAQGLDPLPLWAPNQLRHSVASNIAEEFDKSSASAVLGNTAGVIDIYVEQELAKAAKVAARMG